jgi:hypothetical protein
MTAQHQNSIIKSQIGVARQRPEFRASVTQANWLHRNVLLGFLRLGSLACISHNIGFSATLIIPIRLFIERQLPARGTGRKRQMIETE